MLNSFSRPKDEKPKFPLGHVVATPNALGNLTQEDIQLALHRHVCGDWGIVPKDDHDANNRSLEEGTRLLSAYTAKNGTKFWIITEADRSATTVLLPEDY